LQAHELTADPPKPATDQDPSANRDCGIRVEYHPWSADAAWPDALAIVHFGAEPHGPGHGALSVHVRLPVLHGQPQTEVWWADGPVHRGTLGPVRYAHDRQHLFGVVELDEREHGGIAGATAVAYGALSDLQRQSAFPHLLRVWNYFDAINEGAGDLERYRQFCVGRTRGVGDFATTFPAATAIGHQKTTHQLQVFWLASRTPGIAVENPRQVSAYRYPRMHGPVSPTFARAMIAPDRTLLISGTASIVGHSSMHDDDPIAQLEETLRNLSALHALTDTRGPVARALLKLYVRDASQAAALAGHLAARLPAGLHTGEIICLAADICRRELLLEIEGLQLRSVRA